MGGSDFLTHTHAGASATHLGVDFFKSAIDFWFVSIQL